MTLMKRNNLAWPNLNTLFDDVFTKDFFGDRWSNGSATGTTIPAVNIVETNEDFRVEMAAPGMTKKDFNIRLDNDTLVISSVKEDSNEEQSKNYTRCEFSYQSFERKFYLPNIVDADHIKATYQNGVLNLIIPKREEARHKPARQIAIS